MFKYNKPVAEAVELFANSIILASPYTPPVTAATSEADEGDLPGIGDGPTVLD